MCLMLAIEFLKPLFRLFRRYGVIDFPHGCPFNVIVANSNQDIKIRVVPV
jgi:hypothetical protein